MRKRQSGMTFIGLLLILVPIGILVYAGIRLTPIYLNYYRVVQAVTQVATENKDNPQVTQDVMRNSLARRFDVQYVEHPTPQEIQFRRDDGVWTIIADYEDIAPLFGNVSLLMQFHKEVKVQ